MRNESVGHTTPAVILDHQTTDTNMASSNSRNRGRSLTNSNGRPSRRSETGVRVSEGEGEESEVMSAVRQATLLNYHLAIEDSVDLDKIWDAMQDVFTHDEQSDIQVRTTTVAGLVLYTTRRTVSGYSSVAGITMII